MRWLSVLLLMVACTSQASRDSETPEAGKSDTRCWRNGDCSGGQRCFIPEGSIKGVCGDKVDELGMPDHSVPMPTDSEKTESCSFDTDCPPLFRCKKLDALHGVCLKR